MFHSLKERFFSSFYSMKQSAWQVGSINYFVDILYSISILYHTQKINFL